ncbi:MAG: hypothetical protein ACREF3_14360 [Acetobacteraceae bacterium]
MSGSTWKSLKGKHSDQQYDWINGPPVIEVTDVAQLRLYATQMKTSIEGYDTGGYETYDDELNLIEEVDNWNDRVSNSISILELIIKCNGYDYNVVYRVLGTPVGILCVGDNDPAHIFYLVAHPGTDNAGGTLMELAADWSEARGKGGRLDLYSYDKKSTAAYKAMGFVKSDGDYDSGGDMTLNPSTSDKWTKAGTNWKLAKYVTKGYYATRAKPLPIPTKKNL